MVDDAEGDETDDEADLPDFDSSPSLSDDDVASLLSSIADSRSDVSNAKSLLFSFLTETSSGSRVTDFCFCFFCFEMHAGDVMGFAVPQVICFFMYAAGCLGAVIILSESTYPHLIKELACS